MPAIAVSYNDPGIPQDLWPSIKDLDAVNSYVTSNAGSVEVSQKFHQWENDPFAIITGQNTIGEATDTVYANQDPVLQGNYTEIIERGVKITQTTKNSAHPATGDRWAREKSKKQSEFKNQLEWDAINGIAAAGAGTGSVSVVTLFAGGNYSAAPTVAFSAPTSGTTATGTVVMTGSMVSSVTITNAGTGYVSPPAITFVGGTGTGASAYCYIAGVARASAGLVSMIGGLGTVAANTGNNGSVLTTLTPTMLNGYLGQSDANGATIDTVLVNSTMKSRISGFTANNTRNVDASAAELVGRVDTYDSDFGRIKIIYHRNIVTSALLGYIGDYMNMGFLDPMHWEDRPAAGYYLAGAYVGEVTYQLSNPLAGLYYTFLQ